MKVGREEIVGFVVALRRYLATDHAPSVARWRSMADRICDAVDGVGGASAEIRTDHTVSIVAIRPAGDGVAGLCRPRLVARLRSGDEEPRIWAGEEFIDEGRVALNVQHLRDDEVAVVIERLRTLLPAD